MRCIKPFSATRLPRLMALFLVVVSLLTIFATFRLNTQTATAATNNTINFQARLMQASGAIVPDGTYNVEFKIYNAASSSGSSQGSCTGDTACKWTETRTGGNKISIANGYLTANLGSVTTLPAIDWDQELWLTMNIGGTGTPGWDGEMSPRLKLTAVPYAMIAGQLAATNGSFRSNLSFVQPTANRNILIPDESGTICLQSSTACGFLTGSAADYIQNNQTGSPQSANIFIQNAGANSANTATLKLGASQTGAALNITDSSNVSLWKATSSLVTQTVGLRISVNSTTADTFTTPGGASVKSAINIPLYDPGAFGQLLAFGLPSGAQTSSRAISVFDARSSGVIQPAIALFSPNENEVFGLTWNGLNTVASIESSGSTAIALRPGGVNVKLWAGSTGVAIGNNVSSAAYPLDVTGDINTSTQYRIGSTVICTATGCTPAAGSTNYIQNTTTLQSANMAVQAASSGSVTAVLQANAAGTADILSLRNGAGGAVASFGYGGAISIKTTTDSLNGFRIQNNSNATILNVDTINQRIAVGNAAPALKFEVQDGDAAIYNSGNNARLVLGDSATSGQYGWLQWDSANDYFRIETAGSNGFKIKDNYVSIGNIFPSKPLIVGAGTTALFEVGATGQIQARTSTNTATAFQIQNDVGGVYFNGDSTNKRIGIGANMIAPEVTLDVAGAIQQTGLQTSDTGATDNNKWTKLGTCTLTAQFTQCLATLSIVGGHDGSTTNNTQGTVSVRVKQQNALGGAPYVNVNLNDTTEVITKEDIVAVTTVNNGTTTTVELYGRITNTFEHWAYTPIINNGNGAASTWDWTPTNGFVAALPGGTQNVARFGNLNANLMKVESTDTNAFTIQNAGGTNKLLVANTNLMRLAVNQATAAYTLDVAGDINSTTGLRVGTNLVCDSTGCTAKSGSGFYIHNQTTVQASNFWVQAATTGTVAGIIQAFNGGTGDILQLKNGAGADVAVFASGGAVTLQNSTTSTSAFRVLAGAGGNSILRVDSTNEKVAIGVISDPIGAKLSIATSTMASLRAYQGSTNDVLQLANSAGDIFNVKSTGEVNMRTRTNSATAFQVQNDLGNQVFGVDTVDGIVLLGTGFGAKHIAMDIETNPYIEVVNTAGNGVGLSQVESGNAYLNHDTDLIIQRTTNSATDLQVLDDTNIAQFTVDTSNKQVEIGTSDATGTILVLDTKTGAGDPTGVEGAMYYNSSSKAFRCYMNARWRSCVSGVVFANTSVPGGNTVANTVTETNFASNYSIPANDCQPGRVYRVTAQGVYGTTTTAPTLNIRVKLGTTALVATGAQTTTISMTNREWRVEFQLICISTGAAGTVEAGGAFTRFTSAIASVLWEMSNTAVVPSIDTTAAQTLQISAQFGTANAANTITMRQFIVEASGP